MSLHWKLIIFHLSLIVGAGIGVILESWLVGIGGCMIIGFIGGYVGAPLDYFQMNRWEKGRNRG